MPTGYTDSIYSNKPTSFRQFALGCARAMGALIMMRDEPMDAPIKLNEPSDYYSKALKDAQITLDGLALMSQKTATINAEAEYRNALERYETSMQEQTALRSRYDAMLQQVKAWEPPTPDHTGLKKLMIEQLERSIAVDTNYLPQRPKKQSGKAWLITALEKAHRDVIYHTEQHRKELERTAERNDWINSLLASLPD